jgi:hypothetical protein
MLRRGLDKAGIATVDHDIWDDPDAAAVVRSHANGNETVPTVVIGDVGLVNPSTRQVAGSAWLIVVGLLCLRRSSRRSTRCSPPAQNP